MLKETNLPANMGTYTLVFPKDLPFFKDKVLENVHHTTVKCGNKFIEAEPISLLKTIEQYPVGTMEVDSVSVKSNGELLYVLRIHTMELKPAEIPEIPSIPTEP